MGAVLQNSDLLAQGRPVIGVAAGVLAAVLASNASWKLTDWFLARREGAR